MIANNIIKELSNLPDCSIVLRNAWTLWWWYKTPLGGLYEKKNDRQECDKILILSYNCQSDLIKTILAWVHYFSSKKVSCTGYMLSKVYILKYQLGWITYPCLKP